MRNVTMRCVGTLLLDKLFGHVPECNIFLVQRVVDRGERGRWREHARYLAGHRLDCLLGGVVNAGHHRREYRARSILNFCATARRTTKR